MNPIQCLLNPILQTHRPYSVVKEDSNQQSRWTGKQAWINQAVSVEATARTPDGRRSTFQRQEFQDQAYGPSVSYWYLAHHSRLWYFD